MINAEIYEGMRTLAKLSASRCELVLDRLQPEDVALHYEAARTDWRSFARKKQLLPPGEWRWCVFLAGRTWGKTRAGAEAVREKAESGEHQYMSIVGPTMNTVHRDMLFGPSGLMTVSPKWFRPTYIIQRNELIYPMHPVTGIRCRVALLSADRPERIRGSQASFVWCDEPQSWTKAKTAFEMVDLGLRLGMDPRGIVSMTPKATAFVRDLILGSRGPDRKRRPRKDMVIVHGLSRENTSIEGKVFDSLERSLDPAMVKQEMEAEILEVPEGALWLDETIERFRVSTLGLKEALIRVVVGLDPSKSRAGIGDEAGIIVAGKTANGHIYVLEDGSMHAGPLQWASTAAGLAVKYNAAEIAFEANAVSPDVAGIIRQVSGETRTKWEPITAVGKKEVRAHPVAMLYEAGLVHHVGTMEGLEQEMTTWDPTDPKSLSPNRVDALVWAITRLSPDKTKKPLAYGGQ